MERNVMFGEHSVSVTGRKYQYFSQREKNFFFFKGPERLCNWFNITQLVGCKSKIYTQATWLYGPHYQLLWQAPSLLPASLFTLHSLLCPKHVLLTLTFLLFLKHAFQLNLLGNILFIYPSQCNFSNVRRQLHICLIKKAF